MAANVFIGHGTDVLEYPAAGLMKKFVIAKGVDIVNPAEIAHVGAYIAGKFGHGFGAESGRVRGLAGSYYGKYDGFDQNLPDLTRPPLPPGVPAGGHGGSHGRLMDEFVTAILQDRKPLIDIVAALNMTVGGIVAHQSALKGGEWMKIPQYSL